MISVIGVLPWAVGDDGSYGCEPLRHSPLKVEARCPAEDAACRVGGRKLLKVILKFTRSRYREGFAALDVDPPLLELE